MALPPPDELSMAASESPLSQAFLHYTSQERRTQYADLGTLETSLRRLFDNGSRAFPTLDVSPVPFAGFLGSILAGDPALSIDSLRAGELLLVFAYGRQVRGASDILEQRYMPAIKVALDRIGMPSHVIVDVQQDLRTRLVEMLDPSTERRGYSGRGDLAAWLCVAAVREAGRKRERGKTHVMLDDDHVFTSPATDPELAYLRKTYAREFQEAFQEAFASLESRERNVLRYHFLERRSIDQIGAAYHVHRATAARWVNQAREGLCLKTRDRLAERISLSDDGFRRMLSLIDSQISVHLAAIEN